MWFSVSFTLCIAAHSVLWQHCSSGMMCRVSLTFTSNLCSRRGAHLHSPKWPLLKLVVVASAALYSCCDCTSLNTPCTALHSECPSPHQHGGKAQATETAIKHVLAMYCVSLPLPLPPTQASPTCAVHLLVHACSLLLLCCRPTVASLSLPCKPTALTQSEHLQHQSLRQHHL